KTSSGPHSAPACRHTTAGSSASKQYPEPQTPQAPPSLLPDQSACSLLSPWMRALLAGCIAYPTKCPILSLLVSRYFSNVGSDGIVAGTRSTTRIPASSIACTFSGLF